MLCRCKHRAFDVGSPYLTSVGWLQFVSDGDGLSDVQHCNVMFMMLDFPGRSLRSYPKGSRQNG